MHCRDMKSPSLAAAIRETGVDAFCERASISRRTAFNWLKLGVPADRVAVVARLTGLPASAVRPNLAALFHSQMLEPSA